MSLPPVTVHIKRKRTDEPVNFLHIHHGESGAGKRQKLATTNYIFSRQPTEDGDGFASSPIIPQPVRRIKQLHRSASSQALDVSSQSSIQEDLAQATPLSQDDGSNTTPTATPPPKSPFDPTHTPRRFHMSRSATPLGPTPSVAGHKRKVEPAVFVERRTRPRSSEGQTPQTPQTPQPEQHDQNGPGPGFATPTPENRPRKKPGLAARSSTPQVIATAKPKPNVAPLRNVRLPSGRMIPWDISSERLAAEMQAYTLEEIGRTLAAQEATKPEPKPVSTNVHRSSSSKFKPKKPTMRYAERHPEEKAAQDTAMELDEPYIEDEDMDDADYIIDTYVRIPAEALEAEEHQKNFGLLVLDSQPDIDEFYREEEESDEEEEDEEEDENAENHYTADYPDEEVDEDDEYGRNAYRYRTGNASDLEEYDEDEDEFGVALSDDDGESTKYPWKTKPWMKRPEKGILDEEDGDV